MDSFSAKGEQWEAAAVAAAPADKQSEEQARSGLNDEEEAKHVTDAAATSEPSASLLLLCVTVPLDPGWLDRCNLHEDEDAHTSTSTGNTGRRRRH
jgi:hypothetical protein